MLIVLDTTETFADLRVDGANYTFLRSFVARNPANLVVPQIVIEETVNHFRESLERHWDAARTALRNMKKLAPDGELRMVGDFIVETECDKYRGLPVYRLSFDRCWVGWVQSGAIAGYHGG